VFGSPRRLLWVALCLVGGCFSESFGGGSQSGGTAGTAGETAGCVPGAETCPCLEGGRCDAGLVCASQLCVDLGGGSDPTADPDDSGEGGGTAKTTDDGGDASTSAGTGDTGSIGEPGSCEGHCGESVPNFSAMCFCDPVCATSGDCCDDYVEMCGGGCAFNEDCGDLEVCSVGSSTCVEVFSATYEIVVDEWKDNTPTCWDGLGDCFADVYYEVYYGGEPVFTSSTVDDVVTTGWTDPWTATLDPQIVLSFAFWDDDTLGDESLGAQCFTQEDQSCGAVPAAVLHAGTMLWDPGGESLAVQVRFQAQ
jgi:hypothetical protein